MTPCMTSREIGRAPGPRVIETAEIVIHPIAETYSNPNVRVHDLDGKGARVDILRQFGEACREDLKRRGIRAYRPSIMSDCRDG
jgi:hypothetical protein